MRNFRKILVTGGAGFVGSELVSLLLKEGFEVHVIDDLSKGLRSNLPKDSEQFVFIKADLRDRSTALSVVRDCDWVMHLASQAYGVAYCGKNHAMTYLLNCQINTNVIEAVIRGGIPGLLAVSSSCVYSDETPDGMTEDLGFQGEPEIANWGYGWAKRMLEVGVLAATRDGKCEGIIVRPVNIYGANYGWFGEDSHVIPSLVKRVLDTENPLAIWGDGTQSRSFMHVKDAARALLDISLRAPSGTVVNLGDENAISINEIVNMLRDIFELDFHVKYNLDRPTGRKIKSVSSQFLRTILPEFIPKISLEEGLKEMKEWYQRHKALGVF
jgi:nucleoside-diphosphate-sugar epimerase